MDKLENDSLNLAAYVNALLRHKWVVLVLVILAPICAIVVCKFLPRTYRAEASILPLQSKPLGSLGGSSERGGDLVSVLSSLSGGNIQNTSTTLLAILKSRTVAEIVIEKENLMPELFPVAFKEGAGKKEIKDPAALPTLQDAVGKMRSKIMKFKQEDKMPTVTIRAVFESPELASRVVNRYVEELQNFINRNTLSMATRNRVFAEKQLTENKVELLMSGKELSEFYQTYNISNKGTYLDLNLPAGTSTSGAMTHSGRASAMSGKNEDKTVALKRIPVDVFYEYLTLHKSVLTNVNNLLAEQYELAKLNEAREGLAFQVIDEAVPPVRPYGPQTRLIALASLIFAFCLGSLYAFVIEHVRKYSA